MRHGHATGCSSGRHHAILTLTLCPRLAPPAYSARAGIPEAVLYQ
jgi:hypothetical protein